MVRSRLLVLRRGVLRLARQPALGAAAAGAALVLGVASASSALYARSAGAGAVDAQLAQLCPADVGAQAFASVRVDAAPHLSDALERQLARGPAAASLGAPVTTVLATQTVSVSGPHGTDVVQLMARTGAFGHVRILRSTPSRRGVLVPSGIARELRVRPGGRIGVSLGGPVVRVPVAGVYQDMTGQWDLPPFWCSQRVTIDGTSPEFPPPPLLLAPAPLFASIAHSLHVGRVSFELERPLVRGRVSLTAAGALHRDLARLHANGSTAWSEPNALGFLVVRAKALQRSVQGAIEPVAVAGIAVAFGLVGAAAVYWFERRRREIELLRARGVGPLAVAAQAIAELGPWTVVSALVGAVLAVELVLGLGPSGQLGPGAWGSALVRGAVAAGIALAVAALVVIAGASWRGGRRTPPGLWWGAALVAGAGLVVAGLLDQRSLGHAQPLAATGVVPPPLSPLFLSFPILLLCGGVAIVATAFGAAARLARRRTPDARSGAWRRVVVYLAARRVQAHVGVSALLVAACAVAVGVLVYATGVSASEAAAIDAKAAVFVGSESAFQLGGSPALPPALAEHATKVERFSTTIQSGGSVSEVDVLGVDPRTFATGAFWRGRFANKPLPRLLGELARANGHSSLPVIAANASVADGARLQVFGHLPVALDVVATTRTFPGSNGNDLLLVTTQHHLDRVLSTTHATAGTEVWTTLSQSRAAELLGAAHIPVLFTTTVPQVTSETGFLAVRWSFAFLSSLGVLVGLLALAGLALHLEARERSQALAYALGARMGLGRRAHLLSLAHELAGLLFAGFCVGGALAVAAVVLVHSSLDPDTDLPPPLALVVPVATFVACGLATAAAVALGSAWGQRVVERRPPSELIRHDA